jgi:hypothetical protein
MTNEVAKNALMESEDTKASILAAFARIESVPTGATLIETVSDADWCDEDVAGWDISVGVTSADSDELDDCDKEVEHVA